MLFELCKNFRNLIFVYYLFEFVVLLVKNVSNEVVFMG